MRRLRRHLPWLLCSIIAVGLLQAALLLPAAPWQATAHAASRSALTNHPHVAGPRNRYSDTQVAQKLQHLHVSVPSNISFDYVPSYNWPTLFVHGFNSSASIDCNSYWGTAESFARGQGLTGTFLTVGFYSGDHNCAASLGSEAYRCTGYYAGSQGSTNEDLRHVSCELAWYIWDHFTVYGQNVQIVSHSMGGLLARWALYATPFDPNLPPYLMAQDVVTMATPHGGIPVVGGALFLCGECKQGQEMRTNNPFWEELNASGQNPQGAGWGTDWTMMGSSCESFYNITDPGVSWQSALDMTGGHKTEYLNPPCYDHGAYLRDTSTSSSAHANWCDGCAADVVNLSSAYWPHSLLNMVYALEYSYY